ncbi:MAG TPA: SagB/ThcOx family dehydrogenase [Candidatus Peribacteraceae bacterium]|nr:SagB/ThcOx family dehydrogenase [Candidatus Peribacteraceae bacterium]
MKARWSILFFLLPLAACSSGGYTDVSLPVPRAMEPGATISLPPPAKRGGLSVEEAMLQRRSVRVFTEAELTLQEVSQLLWALQGITSEQGGRIAPSAGALYPLEVYVALPQGFYHYSPRGHILTLREKADVRDVIARSSLGQASVDDAAAVFLITGVVERTAQKYGERAERYVHLEAGHAAQNLLLQAVALGLGSVPVGAFNDARLQSDLFLPGDHKPLYVLPVGHAAQ